MLSDNIKYHRKKNYLSQDELAEKVGVSRQSVSFWENGQTQPTIDNIIALSKAFNISSDALLGNTNNVSEEPLNESGKTKKNSLIWIILAMVVVIAIIVSTVILGVISKNKELKKGDSTDVPVMNSVNQSEHSANDNQENPSKSTEVFGLNGVLSDDTEQKFDLFTYCKNFAIKKGTLNGDYCIYQQPSSKYGGYDNEYFSVSYWSDSNMVEFCLHCPLNETQSHNFYLRMRGGYNGKYEYLSSKYYRDTGEPFRNAIGYIDPSVFSESYPISCDAYEGNSDGQNEFMEESRVGICDLIKCLKKFVATENMECDFSDFEFVNF